MRKISYNDVISLAKDELHITHSDSDIYFKWRINECLRNLNIWSLLIQKQKVLELIDGKAEVPEGYYNWIGVVYGDIPQTSSNRLSLIDYSKSHPTYYNTVFIDQCSNSPLPDWYTQPYGQSFRVDGQYIYFQQGDTPHSPKSKNVTLSYMGYDIDEHGFMNLYDDMEFLLVDYLCYRYILQNLRSYRDPYAQQQLGEYKRNYLSKKRKLAGEEARKDWTNRKFELDLLFRQININHFN